MGLLPFPSSLVTKSTVQARPRLLPRLYSTRDVGYDLGSLMQYYH